MTRQSVPISTPAGDPPQTATPPATLPEFVWIWNRTQRLPTPGLHLQIATWLETQWLAEEKNLLLLAFRSSGKSTLVGLFCAWLLAGWPDLRVLILAADFALAKKMVRNVKRIIERHPLTRQLKGGQVDQWASDQFTVRRAAELRDPSMLAKGIDANITGLRADVVICDDVEVPNTCDTAAKREDLRARLREIDYVLVPGGCQLYVGTPHSYYSIYAETPRPETGEERPFLDGFRRLCLPLLHADGRSRWPERFPPDHVEQILLRTGPSKFQSQMMLKPRNFADGRLNPSQLRFYEHELVYKEGNSQAVLALGNKRLVSASCWWDPAYGSPNGGDASVVAVIFTDIEGEYWLHRIAYLEHDASKTEETDEATQQCSMVVDLAKSMYIPAIRIETNGLGKFLPGLLRLVIKKSRFSCAVIEMTSTRNKDVRILEAFDSVLAAGRLNAHTSIKDSSFIEEMREWRPGSRCGDDGLDAVAGCLLSEPVRLHQSLVTWPLRQRIAKPWRLGIGPFNAQSDFDL